MGQVWSGLQFIRGESLIAVVFLSSVPKRNDKLIRLSALLSCRRRSRQFIHSPWSFSSNTIFSFAIMVLLFNAGRNYK